LSRVQGDLLRLVSIVAVLFIHATGQFEKEFGRTHIYLSQDFIAVVLNQISRFAVPVFIMLSGFGLTKKYMTTSLDVRYFYLRRATKIGIPFLVWTIVFGILNQAGLQRELSFSSVLAVFQGLALKMPEYLFVRGADYHFYFFIIILQCYLVFPIVFRVNSRAFLLLLLGWQILWTSPAHLILAKVGIVLPSLPSSSLAYWLFYFYVGIYSARRGLPVISGWIVLLPLVLVIAEFLYWSGMDSDTGNYDHFNRWSVIAYSLLCFITRPGFAWLETLQTEKFKISSLAQVSFAVFIFHTNILRFLEWSPIGHWLLGILPALIILSFGFCLLLDRWLRADSVRIAFGLPEKNV